MKLGFIGYGSIARQALTTIAKASDGRLGMVAILAKPDGVERARALLDSLGAALAPRRIVVSSIHDFLGLRPDLVAEAAGHAAILAHGARVLASGRDLVITSAGSLADERLSADLDAAAREGGARILICPGAVGGLDIIAAAKLSGLTKLVYTSRKPPLAWRGTAAERIIDLGALREPRRFFEGTAREAARRYPQNANVAATIALHGAGFETTLVRLVADPGVARNTHVVTMSAACADVEITIAGLPSPDNPKTSMTTGFALAAQILLYVDCIDGSRPARRSIAIPSI